MDNQCTSHARSYRKSRTFDITTLHEPQTLASTSSPRDREKRRATKVNGPRSIPHNGAICDNTMCDAPDVKPDERLCRGPEGLQLCSRCYKRFKIERRRAKEMQRTITNDWMKPIRRRPISTQRIEQSYRESPPNSECINPKTVKRPSPVITPRTPSEKSSSLHNFPTDSLNEYDSGNNRPLRNHRPRRGRDFEKHLHDDRASALTSYEEAEYYKYGRAEEGGDYDDRGCRYGLWHRKRKCLIIGLAAVSVIVLVIIISLAATLTRQRNGFRYIPSTAQVNNTKAFELGGATRNNVNDTSIGIGAGTDTYTYYRGNASNFPSKEKWVSFKDMWEKNLDTFKYSCGWLGHGKDNSPEIIQDIYNAIQDRANASLVDHRIILATILQETNGCPLNPPTTSSGGTRNPGLMQSHNGHSYDEKHSRLSILLMIQDGTQGTEHGWGLVDNLNTYSDPYKAMRGYNSGYIPNSGNLSEKAGATACYVSDIANRLTGWVRAKSTCPDDAH